MNRLSTAERARIIACLVEGNSIRATVRMTGYAKNTIVKLLAELGGACSEYMNDHLRDLPCRRVQCDEIWSFCYAKEKNVPADLKGQFGVGDVWTWTAICADTKIVPSFMVGNRDGATAKLFIEDLASRLRGRIQLSTDGHKPYLEAVEGAFGCEIDYAMIIKHYGNPPEGTEKRYSPAECCGTTKTVVTGKPDRKHISTSYVERQNLTMRMGMRRFTRLTNGFSKKVENLAAAVALHFMHYNFVRVHQTLGMTPAMAAGKSGAPWTVEMIAQLID